MINDQIKAENLRSLYTQLQAHNLSLRDRIFQITSATITIMLIISGWMISIGSNFNNRQKYLIVVGLLLVFICTMYSIYSHYKEYLSSARMIVRIEKAMAVYEKGIYFESDTLYDPESQQWGTGRFSRHMIVTHALILMLFLLFSILLVFFL